MTGILHIVVARKPIEGTIAENCLKHGCGALNVDGCRVGYVSEADKRLETRGVHFGGAYQHAAGDAFKKEVNAVAAVNQAGRFPANLILDMSTEVQDNFPSSVSVKGKPRKAIIKNPTRLNNSKEVFVDCEYNDSGNASRFFFNFTEQESNESGDM